MSTVVYIEAYFDNELVPDKKGEDGLGWGYKPEKESFFQSPV